MKYSLFLMIIFVTSITGVEAKTSQAPEALVAMAKKLSSLKSISYQHHCERSYPRDDYFYQKTTSWYVEFNQTDKRSLTRFRMESDDEISVYNGTEEFNLYKKEKTYHLSAKPNPRKFGRYNLFINSIQELHNEMPQLIAGDSIPMYQRDTLIDNKLYKLVQLNMRRWLQYMGNSPLDSGVVFYYRIIIDPETWMPYQVIHTSNINTGNVNKTTYTDINIQPAVPADNLWYYTTYLNEYQPEKKEKKTPLIAAGAMMTPQWSLPEYNGKDNPVFNSSELKGKLVLLDFWIKNCGYCMESFPELQRLQKTYGGDRFQLVTINARDKKEQIDFFYKREKPLYKMLYDGQAMAAALGVNAYPTLLLIDKGGKVIYAGHDYKKAESLIRANL